MSIELEDLNTEKDRLEADRKTLLESLNELQTQIGKVQTQIQAISGAVQTCDYFINKIHQPPQAPALENEDKEAGDGKNKGK